MNDSTDLARVLLDKAAGDETVLRKLIDDAEVPDAVLGFHAQQAVEKGIKAVLSYRAVPYEFRHDIEYLRELLVQHGEQLPEELARADDLTPWAMQLRYEQPETPARLDRAATLALASAALAWARGIVPAR